MLKDLFALFYPNHCYKCEDIMPLDQKYFCFKCDQELHRFDNSNPSDNLFHDRLFNKLSVVQAYSYFAYQKSGAVQELIHDLKYAKMKDIGAYYGSLLGKIVIENIVLMPDIVVPVPLSKQKFKVRGYNQAEVIAKGVSDMLQVPMLEHGIVKKRNTRSQTRLSRLARWSNVTDVFSVEVDLEKKHLLLVDDVFTTGSTLEAFGKACLSSNCGKISIATLGIAV
jgi:ComF family protein